MAFSLTWLAEVLEDAGLKVAEQPGWRTRGRGDVGTVRGDVSSHRRTAERNHAETSGNSSFIGIEAENTGLANDPWPAVQIHAYRRGVAAILKKIGQRDHVLRAQGIRPACGA